MRVDFQTKIHEAGPTLFRSERTAVGSLPPVSIDCGDGWFRLILELTTDLEKMIDRSVEIEDLLRVCCVKEKFGGLRYYVEGNFGSALDSICDRIQLADKLSLKTCEDCGSIDSVQTSRHGGWWFRTLCDACGEAQSKLNEQSKMRQR